MKIYYVTCPSHEVAANIANQLLVEKLIGCANIIPGMQSMYWWNEKIETSSECILLLKSPQSDDANKKIESRIKELHPYEVPCIMSVKIDSINSEYENWLVQSLK